MASQPLFDSKCAATQWPRTCYLCENLRPLGRSDWGMLQSWPGPFSELSSLYAGFQQLCRIIMQESAFQTLPHPHTHTHAHDESDAFLIASQLWQITVSRRYCKQYWEARSEPARFANEVLLQCSIDIIRSRFSANRPFLLLEGPQSRALNLPTKMREERRKPIFIVFLFSIFQIDRKISLKRRGDGRSLPLKYSTFTL